MLNFIKNNRASSSPSGGSAAEVVRLKAQMRRQIMVMAACMLVISVATVAFVSQAWFAMNREATGQDNGVTSDTSSPSLFIRKSGDTTTAFASIVNTTTSAALFPSSTADLTNWYYASGFTYTPSTVNGSGYTYTVNTPVANAYTRIASFTDAAAGTYNNTYEGKTRTAYYRSDVNLYTTVGTLDVYLDSTAPITVSYDSSNAIVAKSLLNCLRVGIYADSAMKLIYAPMAESGTGNSSGSAADTFYYIQSGTLTAAGTNVKTSLTDYLAQKQVGSDLYTATGTTKLCTATTSGADVSVYVWLEGTDAQALYGLADEDLKGINVTINYVGVAPAS